MLLTALITTLGPSEKAYKGLEIYFVGFGKLVLVCLDLSTFDHTYNFFCRNVAGGTAVVLFTAISNDLQTAVLCTNDRYQRGRRRE